MAKKDYYEILGIEKSVDEATIKRAYRGLAMQYHPDRNHGDAEASAKMAEINEAYAVLSDRKKRHLYDTYGHAGLEGYSTTDIFSGIDFSSLFHEFGLGDIGFGGGIFDSLFGSGRKTTGEKRRGADLRYDLEVTLEEVTSGAEKEIEIPRNTTCSSCNGTGAKKDGLKECVHCRGTGQIINEQRSGFGIFRQISTCSHCRGAGQMVKDPCEKCKGKGFIRKTNTHRISIPQGADSGYSIRIEGAGESGNEAMQPGDLYIVLNIKKHPVFERHGNDIFMTREISFAQAALGAELNDIPALNGTLTLDVPEGTQNGALLRIMGEGLPRMDGYGKGDFYVMVTVKTPQDLTEKEKELLREFDKLQSEKNTAHISYRH
jgi:molecular chaperone DnaJ